MFEISPSGSPLTPCVSMKEGETVYDFCWYPKMDSAQPATCCMAVTAQYQPIHLYDAFDGHIRATYRYYSKVSMNTCMFFFCTLYIGSYREKESSVRLFFGTVIGSTIFSNY